MGRRRDWPEEPDDAGFWLEQLTGEIPQVDQGRPADPRGGRGGVPADPRRGGLSGPRGGVPADPRAGSPRGPRGGVPPPGWAQQGPGWEPPGWERPGPGPGPDPFEEQPPPPADPPFAGLPFMEPEAEERERPSSRVELRRTERLRQRRGRKRRLRGIAIFVLLVMVVSGVTYGAYRLTAQRPPKVRPGLPVTFTVEPGDGSRTIGQALERNGVIDSAGRFRAVAQERGLDSALKPGTYQLTTGMNVDQVIDILVRGPNLGPPFTVPEGFTVAQIVDRLVATRRFPKAAVVKALSSPDLQVPYRPRNVKILEGLLFPQTYRIDRDDTAVTVLQQMLDQLQSVMSTYDLRAAPQRLTPYQVLIVASLIEREAKVPADRPKIARVIYNRLATHQRLQVDASVQYALGTSRRLSARDLAVNSPYNTYLHLGLPPTPIASPGEDSIRAALRPAAGPWLFYVLISKDGRHAFTSSAAEFTRLKDEARRKGLL
jgi:UPF0755 protein